MANTNFIDSQTPVVASWLNDVNDLVYEGTIPPGTTFPSSSVTYTPSGTGAVDTTVQSKLRETVSVKDFGAVGDGVTDDTAAFQSALTVLENGGVLYVPLGRYKITDTLVLKTGVTVQGQGNADRTFGIPNTNAESSYIFQTTANKSVFSIGGNTRQIRIKDISLGSRLDVNLVPSTNINGISLAGTWPNSSTDFVVERCSFYNFNKAVSVVDTALPGSPNPDWQCDDVSFNNCLFYMNTDGMYFYTTNSDSWVLTNVDFLTGDNANGLHFNRVGTFTAINCFGGDIVDVSPSAAYGIHIGGDGFFDTMKYINCQWERTTNMMYVETSYYPNQPVGALKIIMDSCQIESDITIAAACNYISFASRYQNSVFVTGNNVQIDSYSDYFLSPNKYLITGTNSGFGSCITSSETSVSNANNGVILTGRVRTYVQIDPNTSTYPSKVGDIALNGLSYRVGSPVGWICGADGTPGTWYPFGQIGSRSASGSPVGVLTPYFMGEEYLDTGSNKWYKSTGLTNTNWVALN